MNESHTLNINKQTRERFDAMKEKSHTVTDGALIWKALARYEDFLDRQAREAEVYRQSIEEENA